MLNNPNCKHIGAVTKRYVGSTVTYKYCPGCMETFEGEETLAKKKLIHDAARANVTELDEVEECV